MIPQTTFPTEEEKNALMKRTFAKMRGVREEAEVAASVARPALADLCEAMAGKTGQAHKLRALLYSLWNGKPASLNEITGLDWELRKCLLHVMLAWGTGSGTGEFFYDTLKKAVQTHADWEWFLERGDEVDK